MGCGASRNQVAPCPAPPVATDRTANDGDASKSNQNAQPCEARNRRRGNKVAPDLSGDKHSGATSTTESRIVEREGGDMQKQSGVRQFPAEEPPKPTEQATEHVHRGQPPTEHVHRGQPPIEHVQRGQPPTEHVHRGQPPIEHVQRGQPPIEHVQRGQPPIEHVQRGQPPIEHVQRGQPPTEHVHRGQPPTEHVHRGQPPTEHVQRGQPPTEHVHRGQPPTEHVHLGQPPTEHVNRGQPPIEHVQRGQPPTEHVQRGQPPIEHVQRGQPSIEEVLREDKSSTMETSGPQCREPLEQSPAESHAHPLGECQTETLLVEPQGNASIAEPLEHGQNELEPSEQHRTELQQNQTETQIPPALALSTHDDTTTRVDLEFTTSRPSTNTQIVKSEIDTSPCVTPSQIKAGLRPNPLAHHIPLFPSMQNVLATGDDNDPTQKVVPSDNEDSVDYNFQFTKSADLEQGVSFDNPPNLDKILTTPNKDRVKGPSNRQPRQHIRSSGED